MSSARETHRPTGPRADTPAANPAAIRNTIDRAHGLLAVSLTMDALAALEKLPRGHIVVLLPYARAAGDCLRTGTMRIVCTSPASTRSSGRPSMASAPARCPRTCRSWSWRAAVTGCWSGTRRSAVTRDRRRALTYLTWLAVLTFVLAIGIAGAGRA